MLRFICLIAFLAWPLALFAEEPRQLSPEITESGRAYQDAVRSVHTTVDYYDAAAPAPEMTAAEPFSLDDDDPIDTETSYSGENRAIISLVVLVLLIGLAIVIVRLSGVSTASFSRAPDRGNRTRRENGDTAGEAPPASLSAIANIADRRLALIMLTAQTMHAAADECGFRIGRSWTLRDVIRRVPRDWQHHGALTTLARAAEAAHFGGHDVAEVDFQTHFATARAIMGAKA